MFGGPYGCLAPERFHLAELAFAAYQPAAHQCINGRRRGRRRGHHVQGFGGQGVANGCRGGQALFGALVEQLEDQGVQGWGQVGDVGAGRDDRGIEMLRDDGDGVVGGKGQVAGGQLVEHDAQRVQVGAPVNLFAHGLLGRHVEDGANDGAFDGDARRGRAGQAKVGQLGNTSVGDDHVLGLQVAVDDAVGMGMFEGVANLAGDLDSFIQGLWAVIIERIAVQ